jgi:HEAT repeat protein
VGIEYNWVTRATTKRKARPQVVERTAAVESLSTDEAAVVDQIREFLADRSPRVRSAAVDVIRQQNLTELGQQVIMALSDSSPTVRLAAVECLGSLHEEESVVASWLYPMLEDSSCLVRIEALESLGRIGDSNALPTIATKLQDEDALVRGYAAEAIAELKGTKYVLAIERALKSETDENAKVRFVDALFLMGDNSRFPELLKFLSSSIYQVRCATANSLSATALTPTQTEAAIKAVTDAARNALFRADRTTMERVRKELLEQL